MLQNILTFAHTLLEKSLKDGDTAIDATCGNGYDTLFLSSIVGPAGKVYAFDIQKQAIEATAEKLQENNSSHNVSLIHDTHALVNQYISEAVYGGAIFNLGYLPRSDKSIITKADSTISALDAILLKLKPQGLVVLVIYYGHPGGKEEKEAILAYASQLDQKNYQVLQYKFINQQNQAPFIIAIEKKKHST